MKTPLRVPDYLEHIRDAIERIHRYEAGLDADAFAENQLIQDAVLRNIEIIGEASRSVELLDPDFIAKHREIEFADARAMRNAVIHGYYQVDLEIVWRTVANNLHQMHSDVVAALHEISGREP